MLAGFGTGQQLVGGERGGQEYAGGACGGIAGRCESGEMGIRQGMGCRAAGASCEVCRCLDGKPVASVMRSLGWRQAARRRHRAKLVRDQEMQENQPARTYLSGHVLDSEQGSSARERWRSLAPLSRPLTAIYSYFRTAWTTPSRERSGRSYSGTWTSRPCHVASDRRSGTGRLKKRTIRARPSRQPWPSWY